MRTDSVPRLAVALLAGLIWVAAPAAEQVTLSVYTALEPEELEAYAQRFNQEYPAIRIQWVRAATGVITERLRGEKEQPAADVVWGLSATSLAQLGREGLLHPFAPPGLERLDPRFRDEADPPAWVGMDAWLGALCVNTVETRGRQLSPPVSWHDLTRPEYEGHLSVPDPVYSGTGFMTVAGWLQLLGEEGGWAFMDALHRNVRHYTRSGSKPCTEAARGEVAIGISFAFRAARTKAAGAPIAIVLPAEGVGWDIEAAAIVAGTQKLEAAATLLGWAIGDAAMGMYNRGHAVLAVPALAQPVKAMPADIPTHMISNDFAWAAARRTAILEEWRRRYGEKTEPEPEGKPGG
jgi:iron(III) transport system substrate-binding protein